MLGERGVDLGQEVVAVVDDGVVVADLVVAVAVGNVEGGDGLQVGAGLAGGADEVGAHFAKQGGAVGQRLQLVDDAHDAVDGVGGLVEAVILLELDELGVGVEHVVAGGEAGEGCGTAAAQQTGDEEGLYAFGNHDCEYIRG